MKYFETESDSIITGYTIDENASRIEYDHSICLIIKRVNDVVEFEIKESKK